MSDDETDVQCPHTDCTELLHIVFEAFYGIWPADLMIGPRIAGSANANAQTWRVECLAGHVLLLPDHGQCPCPDPDGTDECRALGHADAYDWSDDFRTFRPHDWDRLAAVVNALREVAR